MFRAHRAHNLKVFNNFGPLERKVVLPLASPIKIWSGPVKKLKNR